MIGFNWILTLPSSLTAERFDEWYLGIHTKYAQDAYGIRRYCINRAVAGQPTVATGDVFRVAQEYWDDWETMVECWNSASGHVLLGDGHVNMGLDQGTLPGVALTTETRLPVAQPAQFSTIHRGYTAREDGTITKFIAMGLDAEGRDLASWYPERFSRFGDDPLVRQHVFGTTVGKTIPVGMLSSLPVEGQTSYDWNLELWFDSNDEALEFLEREPFQAMWRELTRASGDTAASLVRGQEMLVKNVALPHRDA